MNRNSKQRMSFRRRVIPQTPGESNYYRIIVRPKDLFSTFRTQEIGAPGNLQRLTGKRGEAWITQAWLVSKRAAHIEGRRLIADSKDVGDFIKQLGIQPILRRGDVFTILSRPSVGTLRQVRQRQAAIRRELAFDKDNLVAYAAAYIELVKCHATDSSCGNYADRITRASISKRR
jgi:hypothetical protein